MPRLSDSMEEGTILKWLKSDGDTVARGEPLAEIETDKATLTYESDAAGVLKIVAGAGETLADRQRHRDAGRRRERRGGRGGSPPPPRPRRPRRPPPRPRRRPPLPRPRRPPHPPRHRPHPRPPRRSPPTLPLQPRAPRAG